MNPILASSSFHRVLGEIALHSILKVHAWGRAFSCCCRCSKNSTTQKTQDLGSQVISQVTTPESRIPTPYLPSIPHTPKLERLLRICEHPPLLLPQTALTLFNDSTIEMKREKEDDGEDEINSITRSIENSYQRILAYFPLNILDNLAIYLINFEKKHPQRDSKTQRKIQYIFSQLSESPNILDRLRNNRLLLMDFYTLKAIRDFLPSPEKGEFLKHLNALYLSKPNPQTFENLIACCCSINAIEERRNLSYTLEHLAHNRRKLKAIQKRRLNQLLQTQSEDWMLQAAINPHKKLLINRHTKAGQNLIQACNGRSLRQEFNIHSILIDQCGNLFIRHSSDEPLAIGGIKSIFRVEEYKTGKPFAWTVLKRTEYLQFFRGPIIHVLREFLQKHPNLAFAAVPQFMEYDNKDRNFLQIGISLDPLYDNDAYGLRKHTNEPILKGKTILKLAEAITALHRHGLVHRDLKPENILVNKNGKDFEAVWNDYDFVYWADQRTSHILGTKGFIPFDFILPGDHDLRKADIYSFAITLYQDLDLQFSPPGYYFHLKEQYLQEISSFVSGSKKFVEYSLIEQKRGFKLWIGKKQAEHEANKPRINDGLPYFAYRQFLWIAISPDVRKRHSTEIFEKELKKLHALGELPT